MLPQMGLTFVEVEVLGEQATLVIAAQEIDLVRALYLHAQQQQHHFQTESTAVNVVAEEHVLRG